MKLKDAMEKATKGPLKWALGSPDITSRWDNKDVPVAEVLKPLWHEDS